MSKDCFNSLIAHGRKIDEGIKQLTDTWRYPQNMLGGYGTNSEQAEADLKVIQADVTALKDKIIDDAKSRENHKTEMDAFLEEAQQMYLDLAQSSSDMEAVLSEYGYVKLEDESCDNKLEIAASRDSSLIASDVTDDLLEVEFTPNMTWRHKARSNTSQ